LRPLTLKAALKNSTLKKGSKLVKATTVTLFSVFIIGASGCKPSPDEAVAYNEKIIREQKAIVDKINELDLTLSTYKPTEMDVAYNNAYKQVISSIATVKGLGEFDGKTEFKDAALQVFDIYKQTLEVEYKELVGLLKKSDEEYTLQDEERAKKLFMDIAEKLNNAYEDIIAVQSAFAEKYHFTLSH
jgi:hypothetical protein